MASSLSPLSAFELAPDKLSLRAQGEDKTAASTHGLFIADTQAHEPAPDCAVAAIAEWCG